MDWHQRYLQQAKWTGDLRSYLFQKAGLNQASLVLEVGCGTGAILSELPNRPGQYGLDINREALAQCKMHAPMAFLTQGDVMKLPYATDSFDVVYCHFLLLWIHDPLQALLEMKRVTKRGASIIAFAEPDYTARLDEPPELVSLGQWQAEALRRQGADPSLGRRLADLFFRAGIQIVETGTIQSAGSGLSAEDWESEWAVIESDLAGFIPKEELRKMRVLDEQACLRGERKLHVPTYFAWGQS